METLRVLVVDDEPGMRTGAVRALADFSVCVDDVNGEVRFEVDQTASAEEALARIDTQPPDILLLDHKMPGMSGLDVLKEIARRKLDVLTVMITAYASLDVAITATKRGAYDFLAKPFTPDELRGVVGKAARHAVLRRQARRLAEERRQVRFQFISVLAHELKAPLGAVEGYLNILQDRPAGDDPAAAGKMVDRCLIRIGHMRKMIADLLDLTGIESGQRPRTLEDVDLDELARSALETVGAAADARRLTLTLHADAPVRIHADPGEIEMILNNLVSNAVKYNRDDGSVDVRLARDDDRVVISVTDTGIGMTDDERSRLFGEFVRIRNARTRDVPGSGLGLSIVSRLARLYRGGVSVTSERDVGTTFTVTLHDAGETQ